MNNWLIVELSDTNEHVFGKLHLSTFITQKLHWLANIMNETKKFFFISGQIFYAYVSLFICGRWSNQNGTLWQETYPSVQTRYAKLYCDVRRCSFWQSCKLWQRKCWFIRFFKLSFGNLVPLFEFLDTKNEFRMTIKLR